jgi:hypothetical protein
MTRHPVIVEFRQMRQEKMPDFLELMVYFDWDESPYRKELSEISEKIFNIEVQLGKTTWEDQASQFFLKEQLIELIPKMESIYSELTKNLSEEDWAQFREYKMKSEG